METQQISEPAKKKSNVKAEDIFKIVSCIFVIMWSVCLKYFFEFRSYLNVKNLNYFEFKYAWYILVGFLFMLVTKYGYYALAKQFFDKNILSEKYEGDSRKIKLQSTLKLSYDSLFYLVTSGTAFFLFRGEPWFPNWIGGNGRCQNIYADYPNLPNNSKDSIELFYSLQLGVHLFSVFEMMVIKRKTELKYYEKLLHHILASSLILFSALSNQIIVGVLILFTHDFSDVFLAFGRTYIQTKFKKVWYIAIPIIFVMIFWWIFMRIIVFPLCLISSVGNNDPQPTDSWNMVYYPHKMLYFKLVVLLCMHIYWTYHILRSVFLSLKKKNYGNHHETGKAKQSTQTIAQSVA